MSNTSIPEDSEARPKKAIGPTNPDETYARYERSPFRNYSLNPSQGNNDGPNRKASKNSLLGRFNSVRFRVGGESRRGRRGRSYRNQSNENRPEPNYSLAGPRDEEYESCDSDEGFGDYGRRPRPPLGLGQPFPRRKRGGRWRKTSNKEKSSNKGKQIEPSESGKPEGQVRFYSQLRFLKSQV